MFGRASALGALLSIISLFFPLIALLLARPLGALAVTLALVALLGLRALAGFGARQPAAMTWAALAAAGSLAVVSAVDADLAMRLYPVLMNAAMLSAFAWSLIRPPSMIERFARLHEPDLPESGVRYTRAVTFVWCAFFILNGAAALWTALAASLEVWALYNGLIAYLAMGALFGGELLVRGVVRKKHA